MVGLDNVRVDQVGHQLGLADEVFDELLLVGVVLANDLDRHPLDKVARAELFGLVHNAHAALENFPDDFVAEFALNREQAAHAGMLWQRPIKSSLRSGQPWSVRRNALVRLPFASRGAGKRKISGPAQATKPLIFLGENVFFLLARQA